MNVVDRLSPSDIVQTALRSLSNTALAIDSDQVPKSISPWLPPHIIITNSQFLGVFLFCLISLYAMLISPYPRARRSKQLVALPLLLTSLVLPLLFTCPYRLIQMALAVTAIATSTRFLDLYYVQPWTRVPSRYYLRSLRDTASRSKKTDDSTEKSKAEIQVKDDHYQQEPLMWDMHRFKIELWSPVRIVSFNEPIPNTNNGNKRLWTFSHLFSYCMAYSLILDIILFRLSKFSVTDVQNLPPFQYGLFVAGGGAFIVYFVLSVFYTIASVWTYATGRLADPHEWTMLEHYLPCFAVSPADFWNNWQTLFRYIWVDIGFLPVQRWSRRYLTPERVGFPMARLTQECLPLMSVFTLSGILHAYTVVAVWREPASSQIVYFWIQGVAVLMTKALERSLPGQCVRHYYAHGPAIVGWTLHLIGMSATLAFHVLTMPLFIDPYLKNGMWLEVKERSVLWWVYGREA
ncbi:hypothetical protein BG000_009341 [Podila horticola]|nr:hypothetical protein BG000_009341 [Podila horticola]